MGERVVDYEDRVILESTNSLKRYRLMKATTHVVMFLITVPLAVISLLGEWVGNVLDWVRSALYGLRFQIVYRLRWNELGKKRMMDSRKAVAKKNVESPSQSKQNAAN